MAAQSLPLETLLQIFGCIPGSLAPYASVCRAWQIAIEKSTFADLHINSSNLEDFDRITGSSKFPERTHHVKRLFFKVVLPEYSIATRGRYENQYDRNRNNKVFTQAITFLFQILSSWPHAFYTPKYLELYSLSPSDWRAEPDWPKRVSRQQTARAFPEQELLERRYESSYLELIDEGHLPTADCITSIRIPGHASHRHIAPKAVSKIISHLPRLQSIKATLHDDESKDATLRDGLRNDFTFAEWPSSLRHLDLGYNGPTPLDESLPPPKRSYPGKDSLSIALHQLSRQLESIELSNIMIGPELFWSADASKLTPLWPNLVSFTMIYQPATSSGTWLFECDPAWNDKFAEKLSSPDLVNGRNRFRIIPNQNLDELYLAAGHAAQNMPRLNRMGLEAAIRTSLLHDPHPDPTHAFEYNATLGKATWISSSEFHIADNVRKAWDVVAKSHGHIEICAESTWFHGLENSYYPDADLFDDDWRKEHRCFSWDD